MGALDYLSNFCTVTSTRGKRKAMQVLISSILERCLCLLSQTVEIKVKMDCDGCERRVKNAVTNMKGSYVNLSLSL
ncbi:hypothetical protein RHGRI_028874 [Rhododendron griersonianum]|uniref:HMA domain-containing protein n=1 Tax=Rhododendron griersonianum TaxID=479676 RepID=A0AAV6IHH4_9ERIC|nr:hypothetical protein RHGRI_028874 [Rhododendron griersonianum]